MGLPKVAVPEYILTLPSTGEDVKYRPFLVKEEKLLLMAAETKEDLQIVNATRQVIKNCLFTELNIDKLPIFDIEYIFLWLRGKAKGEEIDLKLACPKCEQDVAVRVNIENIKVKGIENHSNKIELTDDIGLVMKYPNITLQSKIEKIQQSDDTAIQSLFDSIALCIDYIYDQENTYSDKDHTRKEIIDFLESLTDEQFQKISKFFEDMPKVSHKVKIVCSNKKDKKICGYKEELVLEGLQSFFA